MVLTVILIWLVSIILLACAWSVIRGKIKRAKGLPDYYNKG